MRCTCASLKPGTTSRPPASMTRVLDPAMALISADVPTFPIVAPHTAIASAAGNAGSTVWIFALMMMVSGTQGCGAGGGAVAMTVNNTRRVCFIAPRNSALGLHHEGLGIHQSKGRFDLQQDHGHVVVLVGGADERLDFAQDPLAQFTRLQVPVLFDDAAQPAFAEEIAAGVHRLGDAVGVEDDHVPHRELQANLLQVMRELFGGTRDPQPHH